MDGEAKKLSTLTIKTNTDHCELLHEARLIYSFEVENDDGVTKNSLNYSVLDLFATQIQELLSQHFEEIGKKYTGDLDAISFSLGALKGSSEEKVVFLEPYAPGSYLVFNPRLSERLEEFLEYLLFYLEHRDVLHIVVAFHTTAKIDLSQLEGVLTYKKVPKSGVVPKKNPNAVYFEPPF